MEAATSRRPRFSEEDRANIQALLSVIQTDGKSASVSVDRDFLLEDGNVGLFMLHYFPREFLRWEYMNQVFIEHLEDHSEGLAWLPGGSGKSTSLMHWMIYVMCREPQISFIYTEKTETVATRRSRAIMQQLESNKALIRDFGEFKHNTQWSAINFNINQRPEVSPWPTLSVYGTGGAALGNRCNIIVVDDPVTTHNSSSELERASILQWYLEAASTCPSPLPLSKPKENAKYLRKSHLVGTTFHMDDLHHAVKKLNPELPHLWLKAVDTRTGDTLSPRFCYRDMEELKRSAETNPMDAKLLEDVNLGIVTNLFEFRRTKGTMAFNRRYQNEVTDPSAQKFPRVWFEGGDDDFAPPGGYPGCYDKDMSLGMLKNEKFRYVTGIDPQSGSKTSDAARCAIVTLGADPEVPDEIYLVDIDFGRMPLESDNPARNTQVKTVLDHVRRYGSRIALETNNIQAVYAGVIRKAAQEMGMTVSITGHWTSKKGKLDPELGIEAMAPMIENGKLSLPYLDPSDIRQVDELVEEFVNWGVYATKDIVMAFWFAWRVLQRSLKQRTKAQEHHFTKVPIYRDYRPELKFPPHWTPEQRAAYVSGRPSVDTEDDEEL